MELEEEFKITIPDDDAVRIKTIRDLVNYILRHGH
jgi:acyl carrier protein